jgi:hypothetical protein
MIELEKTFLARALPEGLKSCRSAEIVDIYVPHTAAHPVLRIRKIGGAYEITKKEPAAGTDSSRQSE